MQQSADDHEEQPDDEPAAHDDQPDGILDTAGLLGERELL